MRASTDRWTPAATPLISSSRRQSITHQLLTLLCRIQVVYAYRKVSNWCVIDWRPLLYRYGDRVTGVVWLETTLGPTLKISHLIHQLVPNEELLKVRDKRLMKDQLL